MVVLYNKLGLHILRIEDCDRIESERLGVRVERLVVDRYVFDLHNVKVQREGNGAPFLDGAKISISISHTVDYVAIYFYDSACGVDIEMIGRNARRVERKFTNLDEVTIVSSVFLANPHLLIWCAKEALYKYSGVDGAEFREDFRVIGIDGDILHCEAFEKRVDLRYFLLGELLVVFTI